ncbi:glycoside hydrolase family 2 protein [Leeuwenhoekiella parthenopeia]|uniref:beta-galactosidase n=1 Tax=Leeuwenhoekiella parthenopeia TaxID=2890320 RepID=A0ABS8H1I7_9FLAO|nr:glycoside hydrolase family 2 TIM barrel-domain containing protein [Leeuwenhoekiella parthenopeia]MCC4214688.1 hypothetical protein [Leeuwenhoekiella parthenopeia]
MRPTTTVSRIVLVFLFLILTIYNTDGVKAQTAYKRVYLSGTDAANTVDWEFKVSDGARSGEWSTIPVPSNWELHGFGTYNYGLEYNDPNEEYGKEIGSYRHRFEVPLDWKGKVINLVFDGSMTDTRVKINGKSAGAIHQGAFYRFSYDVSNLIKYGSKNLLEVEVAKNSENESVNKAERKADFWIFGGIFRPVFLEILPAVHIKRLAVDARHDGSLHTQVSLNKSLRGARLRLKLYTAEGAPVLPVLEKDFNNSSKQISLEGDFETIKSWNPEQPNLYTAVYELIYKEEVMFSKTETIGFRTVELRDKDGFYINEKRVIFKGVNRHSFYPNTGRALSEANHLEDIRLMKAMNMNAVRMSHYGPDERFLQLCDSLGLFVLDELTGWQNGYDTIVGPKLIKELVLKDENHPSVIIWDHGNEGGWNFANEKFFHQYDIQKRPIIYPWLARKGVDTRHYPEYNFGINRLEQGDLPFMPTEFLHGLYDGGHGAGLDDFWSAYKRNPAFSGGFLWSFTDEAVVRRDLNDSLDADGNHAPDGILGPYREKEGSFYTIKEIWSPIQIEPVVITPQFDGSIYVTNEYLFTNLKECSLEVQLKRMTGFGNEEMVYKASIQLPEALPGETRKVQLNLPDDFAESHLLSLTAKSPGGDELYTWSWAIQDAVQVSAQLAAGLAAEVSVLKLEEGDEKLEVRAGAMQYRFDQKTGMLDAVFKNGQQIALSGGAYPVGIESQVKAVDWDFNSTDAFHLKVNYTEYPSMLIWTVTPDGRLKLEAEGLYQGAKNIDFIGLSFKYPEEQVKAIKWMGQGPYRVWKNRLKGAELGVWKKEYNNTVTGSSFESLVYPEFKGYHGKMYWAELQTTEGKIRVVTETPDLYLRLYTPALPPEKDVTGGVAPPFPEGDLSFLYDIPAIGTKFKSADNLGPSSQQGSISNRREDELDKIILWFDFEL